MTGFLRRGLLLSLLLTALLTSPALGQSFIYFTTGLGTASGDTLQRMNLDGSGLTPLASGAAAFAQPSSVVVDQAAGFIYVGDGLGNPAIIRFDLSGGSATTIVSGLPGAVNGLALDKANGRLYYATGSGTSSGDSIGRVNLDGTGNVTLHSGNSIFIQPNQIALDLVNQFIYVADGAGGQAIRRFNLDGTGGTTVISGLPAAAIGVALDLPNQRLYYTTATATPALDTLGRVNLDGSNNVTLHSGNTIFIQPNSIALDTSAGFIYIADGAGANAIRRFNLDGTGGTTLTSGLPGAALGIFLVTPLPTPTPTPTPTFTPTPTRTSTPTPTPTNTPTRTPTPTFTPTPTPTNTPTLTPTPTNTPTFTPTPTPTNTPTLTPTPTNTPTFTPTPTNTPTFTPTPTPTPTNTPTPSPTPSPTPTPTVTPTPTPSGTGPSITSAANAVFTAGVNGSFQVTASGLPAPTFSTTGPLPNAVTLTPGGLLSGVPDLSTGGQTFAFTLVATNGVAPDATQSFSLRINRRPTGGTGVLATTVNRAASVSATKLRNASSDPDGDTLTVTAVAPTSAQGGSVVLASGTVTYTPPNAFIGNDSFTYTVSDGYPGSTGTGTVNVQVKADAGSLNIVSVSTSAGGTLVVCQGIPGFNYVIQSSDNLQATWTNLSGTLTADGAGRFQYLDTTQPPPTQRFYRAVAAP
ncbi:MAG: cadherin-like domain-containing protein [Verrucomicrobia bacterium]|nr:cadherin-like domain-containing protein [Verrucomicrobiota bacterium]